MPGRVWEQAFELAIDQHGFITFEDIVGLGSDPAILRVWNQRGRVVRVGHGIYRFPELPVTQMQPLMLATLWPSGRGVLSHDTALELYELCDINPDKIHITIPPEYRLNRRGAESYVVHRERLRQSDVAWYEGIRIVTVAVAIQQAINSDVPRQLVRQALDTATKFGRVPKDKLVELLNQVDRWRYD